MVGFKSWLRTRIVQFFGKWELAELVQNSWWRVWTNHLELKFQMWQEILIWKNCYVQDNVYIKHHKQSLGTKTPFFGMFESAFNFTLQWVFKTSCFKNLTSKNPSNLPFSSKTNSSEHLLKPDGKSYSLIDCLVFNALSTIFRHVT